MKTNFPYKLPYCVYPTAAETELHGLQPLPDTLPVITFEKAKPYRSTKIKIAAPDTLGNSAILQMTRMIAASFAINDPMLRHLNPPLECPAEIINITHADPLGNDTFGEWTKENILFWLIRLFTITDPYSPLENILINKNVLKQSLAAVNNDGVVIGGALNINLDLSNALRPIRDNDPFINAVLPFFETNTQFLNEQINSSISAICRKFPEFLTALKQGAVADLNMIARSPALPSEDTFELVAASAVHLQEMGFEYLIISASNQWTGAACELLGATRVHFSPFRNVKRVFESPVAVANKFSSTDGFLSDKDSGCMFYVVRLALNLIVS